MFKKRLMMALFSICCFTLPVTAWANPSASRIDVSELSNGIVLVQKDPARTGSEKLKISKGDHHFYYSIQDNNRFPLQLGDGTYTISVLENVIENKYRMVENREVVLAASNQLAVFLQPIQMIYWNENMLAIAKSRELTKGLLTDREKVAAIYQYVIQNVQYDYEKAKVVTNEYIPAIDATLQAGSGICYDYASLFAAMLRSEGIPAKLVMGHKNDIPQYHAWNEIYFQDTNEWVTIDTTYDSIMSKGSKKPSMIKDKSEYITEKQY